MTLKQLEAFYWAATCRNFAVAAQRVNLSLSSLSKRIAELEASLGQALFDRAGHRAVLTEAGERLVPQAYSLLAAAEALRAGMAPAPAELRGRCRFGVGELSALTWLPRFVKTLGTRHPGLVVEPVVSVGAALERQLAQGDLDVAVIAGRSSHSGIASQPVAEAAFVWCAAPEVLPAGARLDAAVFARWPLVSHAIVDPRDGNGAGAPDQAERLYEQFVERARQDMPHVETGRFGAMMQVSLVNDGPVTLTLDSAMWAPAPGQ